MLARPTLPALVLVLAACSSDEESKPPPPDYATVFDTLDPATPNKLRGVWETKTTLADGTQTSTRIRFTEGYAVGAARCIPADKSRSVLTGGPADLETSALDAASGTLKMKALSYTTRDGAVTCQIALAGNTYDFSIADRRLSLTVANSGVASVAFEKVGD